MGTFRVIRNEVYKEVFFVEADSEEDALNELNSNRREPDTCENTRTLNTSIEEI